VRPGDGDEYSLPCQWTVDYHVSLPDTSAATDDQIVFTVNPDGDILSQTTLPRCLASGFTATPGPSPSEIETPAPTTATPEITNAPSPTQAPADDESDDGSDTLLIVAIGYLARRRRTQAPQPSAPDDESGPLAMGAAAHRRSAARSRQSPPIHTQLSLSSHHALTFPQVRAATVVGR